MKHFAFATWDKAENKQVFYLEKNLTLCRKEGHSEQSLHSISRQRRDSFLSLSTSPLRAGSQPWPMGAPFSLQLLIKLGWTFPSQFSWDATIGNHMFIAHLLWKGQRLVMVGRCLWARGDVCSAKEITKYVYIAHTEYANFLIVPDGSPWSNFLM